MLTIMCQLRDMISLLQVTEDTTTTVNTRHSPQSNNSTATSTSSDICISAVDMLVMG